VQIGLICYLIKICRLISRLVIAALVLVAIHNFPAMITPLPDAAGFLGYGDARPSLLPTEGKTITAMAVQLWVMVREEEDFVHNSRYLVGDLLPGPSYPE
jgi:hypothetical protein